MSKAQVDVHEVTSAEEFKIILSKFKDYEFLHDVTDDDKINAYVEKQLTYGHVIAEYHDDDPVGFISFYDNDKENKTGYISVFALSDELGFMKGKTMVRIALESFKVAKDCGLDKIKIEVDKENKVARKLYEHLGFKYTGEETDHSLFMLVGFDSLASVMGKKK